MCNQHLCNHHNVQEEKKMNMNIKLIGLFRDSANIQKVISDLIVSFVNIEDITRDAKKMRVLEKIFKFISEIPELMKYFEKIALEDIHNDETHKCKYHDGDTLLMHLVLASICMINEQTHPEMMFVSGFCGLVHDIGKIETQRHIPGGIKGFPFHGEKGAIILSSIYKNNKKKFDTVMEEIYTKAIVFICSIHMHFYHSKKNSEDVDGIMKSMKDTFGIIKVRNNLSDTQMENVISVFLNMFVSDNSSKRSSKEVEHKTKFKTKDAILQQKKFLRENLKNIHFVEQTRLFFNYTSLKKTIKLVRSMGYYNILIVDDTLLAKNTFDLEGFKNIRYAIIIHTPKLVTDRDSICTFFGSDSFRSYNVFGNTNLYDKYGVPNKEIKYLCGKLIKPKDNIQAESVLII